MAYGELNGNVIDDVTWPQKVQVVTPIGLRLAQYFENSWRLVLSPAVFEILR